MEERLKLLKAELEKYLSYPKDQQYFVRDTILDLEHEIENIEADIDWQHEVEGMCI